MEMITIKDIAKMCGAGVSTVSRAMNNHPDINEETKTKILNTIKEYNYIPNNSARNLKRTESRAIALLVKGIANPFFVKMIKIMEEAIEKERCLLVLRHVDEEENEVDVAMSLVKERKLRGIIFLGGYLNHTKEELLRLQVPLVFSSTSSMDQKPGDCYSYVSVNDVTESYKMVDYLCKLGHRKIAVLITNEADCGIGRLRLQGYEKALKDNQIELDQELIYHMKEIGMTSYTMENGYELMNELLDSGKEFSAVFAISDTLAIGACKAIFEHGLRVPEDISVSGFDGIDMAHYYNPTITTLRQPVEEMAKETVNLLFSVIRGKETHQYKTFEGELLEGGSTQSYCCCDSDSPS